jgi:methylase of polypeptide subunit release factors
MHEIDTKIKLLDKEIRHYADIVYGDFMEDPTAKTKTYATIVGNPPFVRTKRAIYIDFTENAITCSTTTANSCSRSVFLN